MTRIRNGEEVGYRPSEVTAVFEAFAMIGDGRTRDDKTIMLLQHAGLTIFAARLTLLSIGGDGRRGRRTARASDFTAHRRDRPLPISLGCPVPVQEHEHMRPTATSIALLALAVGSAASAQSVDSPPTTPVDLDARPYSSTAGAIRWARSSDDRIVVGYAVTRDGTELGTFDALSYVDLDLVAGRDYRYTVTAIDDAGQRSGSAAITLSTPGNGTGPTTPTAGGPAAPAELTGRVYSSTAAEIFWARPSEAGLRHEVRRIGESGEVVITTDGRSYYDDALAAGREYRYEVVAIAPDGRRSEASTITLTTLGSAAPPAPRRLTATRYGAGNGEIFWSRAAVPGLRYEVSRDGETLATVDGVSFYDDALEIGRSYRYEVVAIDRAGRRSSAASVTMDNDGIIALVDAERLIDHVIDVITGANYFSNLLRFQRFPDEIVRDEGLADVDTGTVSCPDGGTLSFTSTVGAAERTTDYRLDDCGDRRVLDGRLIYTNGTFDASAPASPQVPGENIVRAASAGGPLTSTSEFFSLSWEGDARLLAFEGFSAGARVDLDLSSVDVSVEGGTLSLREVDTTVVCTPETPLRITGELSFSSPVTGGRRFEVRVLDPLVAFGDGADNGESNGRAELLTGRVSVEADDGSRLGLDWRDGDGTSYRVTVENGDLGGELTLPTAPVLERIERGLNITGGNRDDNC